MSPKRKALPAVAVATLLVLSGCAGLTGQLNEDQQQQVADRLSDRLQELDGFEATMTTGVDAGDRSVTTQSDIAVNFRTGEYRLEVLEPERSADDVTVYNGSAMIVYDESEKTYRTFDTEMSGSAPTTDLSEQFDELLNRTEVIYNGTERVNGKETYKATLVPTNKSNQFVDSVTLWVETDRMVPVKMQMSSSGMGDLTTTVTFSEVELNPEFKSGTFEFEPPADATHKDSFTATSSTERYEDRDEFASAVDLSVPPAKLPEGFSFDRATVFMENNGSSLRSAMLDYTDGENEITVSLSKSSDKMQMALESGENVTVDGHDATYRTIGDETGNVVWSCEDTRYIVFGNLEKSTLVSVANGIGC